jgi:hypothetical protein
VLINGKESLTTVINHEAPRWKEHVIDLAQHADSEVIVRLEAHSNDWSWEFSYWSDVRFE